MCLHQSLYLLQFLFLHLKQSCRPSIWLVNGVHALPRAVLVFALVQSHVRVQCSSVLFRLCHSLSAPMLGYYQLHRQKLVLCKHARCFNRRSLPQLAVLSAPWLQFLVTPAAQMQDQSAHSGQQVGLAPAALHHTCPAIAVARATFA